MRFIETKIFTSKQGIEPLAGVMMKMGLTDFVIEDPTEITELLNKKNTYDWDYIDENVLAMKDNEPNIVLYLEDTDEGKKTLQKIKSAVMELKNKEMEGFFGEGAALGRLCVEDNIIDDETWKNNWKEFFKPSKVTDRIVIKPTWEEYKDKSGELIIELDPGMAFGTGTHPTTSMCMKLMENYAGQFKSVLDVGCGSGILSIAAVLLGAEDVLGIEIDPRAVDVAKENVRLNGFDDKIRILQGDLTKGADIKADLVVANLMSDLVILLSEDVRKNLAYEGLFVSSGILIEKQIEVKAAIKDAGFEVIDLLEEGEWCAILARLK